MRSQTRYVSRQLPTPTQRKKIAKLAENCILGWTLQGDVAGLTTYTTRRHRIVFYPARPADQPPSPDQIFFRSIFKSAIDLWQAMSKPQQQTWQKAAQQSHANIPPTALIVAALMPGQQSTIRTIEQTTKTKLLDDQGLPYLTLQP